MSLLIRLYHRTGDRRYLRAALKAVRPLTVFVPRGGLQTVFRGHLWLEEYPTRPRSMVLNGFMQTLLGLYDIRAYSRTAARLYARGRRSLVHLGPLYRRPVGGLTQYHLGYLTANSWHVESPAYHAAHIRLLHMLDSVGPSERLRALAEEWGRIP
jgi:heparosan-N-sulfate-glucuronate 5-epimerase